MKHLNILLYNKTIGFIQWSNKDKTWSINQTNSLLDPEDQALYDLVIDKIYHWFISGRLPYPMPREEMNPWDDDSWDHIRKFLIHAITLGPTIDKES